MRVSITSPVKFIFVCSAFLVACNSHKNDKKQEPLDSTNTTITDTFPESRDSTKSKPIADDQNEPVDSSLMKLSEEILLAIKSRNYKMIAEHIHPEQGVRFSLYAYVDTVNDKVLLPVEFLSLAVTQKKILWGEEDAREVQIILSLDDYLKKWVYDRDFLKAEKKSINKFIGGGNSLNNLKAIYPNNDFTQFYFSGFEPKYDGMDFRGLRLVFGKLNGRNFLIGVIHDEWTI